MTGWLLDTNVLSELRRLRADREVMRFIGGQPLALLYVSVIAFAEIRFGIELLGDAARRMELNDWLENTLRPMFEDRVLPITEDVMLKWCLLVEAGRRTGHTYAQPDLLIAATALHHGLTVVTRNVAHFERVNVPVLNPWTRTR